MRKSGWSCWGNETATIRDGLEAAQLRLLTDTGHRLVDQVAKSAWLEWLEHKGCQPSLVWNDEFVEGDHFSWTAGRVRCADGPVRYVEFRSRRRKGWLWVLNEACVHLEAHWTQGRDSGLNRLQIAGPSSIDEADEYDEKCVDRQCGECWWTGNDLGLGLIERLSFRPSCNLPTFTGMTKLSWSFGGRVLESVVKSRICCLATDLRNKIRS